MKGRTFHLRAGVVAVALLAAVIVPAPAGGAARPVAPADASRGVETIEACSFGVRAACGDSQALWSGGSSFIGIPLSCNTPNPRRPMGTFSTVSGTSARAGDGSLRTYRVEIEDGLAIDPGCFAASVESVLSDPRSWTATGKLSLARTDSGSADIRVLLASPNTVDRLCAPFDTGGRLSCRKGNRAILNLWRWLNGANAYGGDLVNYRRYLVNHEVGHVLGHGHRLCPGAGDLAPVMMQQTKGTGSCVSNPWPYPGV